MRDGWKEVKIKDLGQVITGNTPPRKQPELYGKHTLFVKPTDINIGEKYCYEPEECYSEKGFAKYKKSLIPKNATCVVTIGSIGQKMIKAHTDLFINQAMNAIIPNDNYDEDFIFYLLKLNLSQLKTFDSGTASGRENVSKSSFSNIKVFVPTSKETQRKIAFILSAYDDLIENNLKRIKLLEEKAQYSFELLYQERKKHWEVCNLRDIISFDIGGGWGKDTLKDGYKDPAYVIRGTDIDDIPSGKLENVPYRWHKESNLKSRRLIHGDIVFEVSGGSTTAGVAKSLLITNSLLEQFDHSVMCASFCKLVRPEKVDYSHVLYLFLQYLRRIKATEIFEKRSASNIVNYNWTAFLEYQKIKIPDSISLQEFNKEVEAIYKLIYNLSKQNQLLKEARDILLPRLITGMIDPSTYSGQVVEKLERKEIKEQALGMVGEENLNIKRKING